MMLEGDGFVNNNDLHSFAAGHLYDGEIRMMMTMMARYATLSATA